MLHILASGVCESEKRSLMVMYMGYGMHGFGGKHILVSGNPIKAPHSVNVLHE